MYAYLRGIKRHQDTDGLVIDVNGVGYEVHCSLTTLSQLDTVTDLELLIHTVVREDAITLFGFTTPIEKQLFLTLIKVNGVGPKMAMSILSGSTVEKILSMIEAEDVKGLTQLPKVGKKTAEQLILSLKGKLPKLDDDRSKEKAQINKNPLSRSQFAGVKAEIASALVHLGFKLPDVEFVVKDFDEKIEFETGLRQGLQALSQA